MVPSLVNTREANVLHQLMVKVQCSCLLFLRKAQSLVWPCVSFSLTFISLLFYFSFSLSLSVHVDIGICCYYVGIFAQRFIYIVFILYQFDIFLPSLLRANWQWLSLQIEIIIIFGSVITLQYNDIILYLICCLKLNS